MTAREIYEVLREKFGEEVVTEFQEENVDPPAVVVATEKVAEVLTFLRDDPRTLFDSLMCLSGVDYEDRMEVVYHLHSMTHLHKVTVKVRTDRENPKVPTVEKVYPVASFHEREAYDLLGIVFEGHSDLRRILLPEDWPGHPLRKDYVYPDSYHGIKV
ncbi:MAG: NADH-quinone oxidoreductase subunit C [Deltaproteobacteria bacterium]|nr:MAG: NADH-quinone oxidoreductase subunit C [Deltaproteobacteria bacterium]